VEARRRRTATISLGAAAIAAASCALALAGGGDASPKAKRAKLLDVQLGSASQSAILGADALTVEVSSKAAGKVRLRGAAGAGTPVKVAKARVARFDDGETKSVELPLTAAGRDRLSGCGEQDLLIKARASEPGDRLGDRDDDRDRVRAKLEVDSGSCAAPGGGGDVGEELPQGADPGPGVDENADSGSPTQSCDPLDPSKCLYPWPNDLFTEEASTDTGRQVALDPASMPRSRQNVPILPGPFNRSDGFSPGNMIVTRVPGLTTPAAFAQTDPVDIQHLSEYDDPGQPVVVINAATGERHPVWAELDANPSSASDVTLIVRPATNFEEGGHYIVALRDLRDASGDPIEAQQPFRVYRDGLASSDPDVAERRPHMEWIFRRLAASGIERQSLYLAWDFTVASEDNLTERALHMRDDAFSQLGDDDLSDLEVEPGSSAPAFTVDTVTNFTAAENSRVARRVEGTFTIPCYLDAPGCPTGSRFALPPGSNIPQRLPGNTMQADYICNIPREALDDPDPEELARPALYGHGLLGNDDEVSSGPQQAMVGEHDFMYCATDWAGFATQDIPNILVTLQDLNNFPAFVDRTQQGFLNFLYLGRLMIHPNGFSSDPAFRFDPGAPGGGDDRSVIDTERLFYDGNSQGGILGGALAALAPDHDRAVLGVPGMNYSTLLRRSSDFHPYAEGAFTAEICGLFPDPLDDICAVAPGDTPLGLYDNYPDELERPLILSLMQMQWDRAEANGYAHHMTDDPLADTPAHEVLLHVAFGDHQVTQWAAEVETRTIGASVHTPAFDSPDRHPDVDELFGIPPIVYDASDRFFGSALVYWDSGPGRTGPPPITNTPPSSPANGTDPHSDPRNTVEARIQKSTFLQVDGWVEDVCDGPCHTDAYTP
jgi:hypothetical protein